jgi:hypothetical protein
MKYGYSNQRSMDLQHGGKQSAVFVFGLRQDSVKWKQNSFCLEVNQRDLFS